MAMVLCASRCLVAATTLRPLGRHAHGVLASQSFAELQGDACASMDKAVLRAKVSAALRATGMTVGDAQMHDIVEYVKEVRSHC